MSAAFHLVATRRLAYAPPVQPTARVMALLGVFVVTPCFAQSAATKPASSPPAVAVSQRTDRAAVARVVAALARDLAGVAPRALVAAGELTSDTAAPRAAELATLVATQLAGRIGAAAHAHTEPVALGPARTAARRAGALVHLTVAIAAGQLRVTADVYPVPRSVWARIREPAPGPIAHAFAQAPIDAEVRTFLAPIPLLAVNVERGRNFESDVLALACGDLDQDGAPEIISVSRRRVTMLRIRGGKVIPLVSRSWPDLAPVAPAPLREPMGFASITERGPSTFVDVGLTDRARSVRLDGALQVTASLVGLALPDGDASACMLARKPTVGGRAVDSLAVANAALFVTGALGPCVAGDPQPFAPTVTGVYDAFASARLVSPRGEPFIVWAGRERGAVELRDDSSHRASIDSAGAQLAVGDLDQDGNPEILTSLDTENPADDAVVVRSWTRVPAAPALARLREIARFPVAAGVRAIAVCPADGSGRAPFVVATADEILVAR